MGADIVIVGGGVAGCSTAYALAARGAGSVVVIERDTIASAGTGRTAGIVRCHYGVPQLAAMAQWGLPIFHDARQILGADVGFHRVGYLVAVGADNVEPFNASMAAQQELGIDTEIVDVATVARLWPTARLDDIAAFCLEPGGGYADGHATAQAFAAAARRLGASTRQSCPVAGVEVSNGAVRGVRLVDGTVIGASAVVLATGPWTAPLLRPLGIDVDIRPTWVQEVLIDPGGRLGDPPVFSDVVSGQYVHMRGAELLVGPSSPQARAGIDDPDVFSRHATAQMVEETVERVGHRFPGFPRPRVAGTWTGVIDETPDQNPIMSATDCAGLFVAAGFSGHGFKISPAVGQLMADRVTGAPPSIPGVGARDFDLGRFAEGRLMRSRFPYSGVTGIR